MVLASMNNLIQVVKQLNRKRNYKTRILRLHTSLFFLDKWHRSQHDYSQAKRVLLNAVGVGGVGDAIVMTGCIKMLVEHGYTVSVLCEDKTSFIFKENKLVQDVFILNRTCWNVAILNKVKQCAFELLIDINDVDRHSPLRFKIIKYIQPQHVMGFNHKKYKLYDTSISYTAKDQHISTRYKIVLELLRLETTSFSYDIHIPLASQQVANQFIDHFRGRFIVVMNTETAEFARNMSSKQISDVLSFLNKQKNTTTIVIGTERQLATITFQGDNVVKAPPGEFLYIAQIVKRADLVISPDTSIVHLACAFNRPLVCMYNNKTLHNGDINNIVWGPNYDKAVQLLSNGEFVSDIDSDVLIQSIKAQMAL